MKCMELDHSDISSTERDLQNGVTLEMSACMLACTET